jgi:prepilin peptidase CpaA
MDLATIAQFIVAAAFLGCLVVIAACDLSSYTIPNSACLAIVWLFLVAGPLSGVEVSLLSHFVSFLAVFAAGFVAFRFGIMGGGDVKSWAAIAAWYDVNGLSAQVVAVTFVGGALGLFILVCRRAIRWRYAQDGVATPRLPRLFRSGEPVPYGVAIAVGTVLSIGHIDLFRSFHF